MCSWMCVCVCVSLQLSAAQAELLAVRAEADDLQQRLADGSAALNRCGQAAGACRLNMIRALSRSVPASVTAWCWALLQG